MPTTEMPSHNKLHMSWYTHREQNIYGGPWSHIDKCHKMAIKWPSIYKKSYPKIPMSTL